MKEKKKYPCSLYHKKEKSIICNSEEDFVELKRKGFDRWAVINEKKSPSNDIKDDKKPIKIEEKHDESKKELTIKEIKEKLVKDFDFKEKDFHGLKKADLAEILEQEIENNKEG